MQQRLLPLFLLPILIGGVGLAIVFSDGFPDFRNYVGGRTIPDVLVKSGRTGKELRLIEYRSLGGFKLEEFDIDLAPESLPSSKNLEEIALRTRLPTLSIVIDPDDLLNRDTGLIGNYSKRGRSWERPAYASYFDNGELRFATGAGLRIHGGKSRAMRSKSFRLHFREMYGTAQISPEDLFEGEGAPIRSIVIHNDVRINRNAEWHFVNPLAYDMARELGCITPSTEPIQFYLNGVYQGPYVLTEHISEDYLKAHFGHDDFVFARTKPNLERGSSLIERGNQQLYDEFQNWLKNLPSPLNVNDVEKRIELLNLTNWIISIVYAGVTDPFQGAALLDETDPNARWFWINWDMDHAFSDRYGQVDVAWEIDSFNGRSGVLRSKDPRSIIFDRLRRESPEYRMLFLTRITEVLNHILNPDRAGEKVAHYEETAISYGISDKNFLEAIKEYVKERPAALRRQLKTYFDAGDSYQLSITSSLPIDLTVDGYQVGEEFVGWYFADTPARIEIPESDRHLVGAWVLNGDELLTSEPILELNLTADTHVEIISSRSDTIQ